MPAPIEIVGTLPAGAIAALLEVFALAMGLMIGANLQAIVTLSARRRLYTRGSATLRDTTWGTGIVEGFSRPRKLLRDCRSLLAFIIAVVVVLLEALTVLQTQPGQACHFYKPSSWDVSERELGCFEETSGIDLVNNYVAAANETLRHVDLDWGMPVNTDVFEHSVLTGAAVEELAKKEKRYVAPLMERFEIKGVVETAGTSRTSFKDLTRRDNSDNELCDANPNDDIPPESETMGFTPLGLEVLGSGVNGTINTTGFVQVSGCMNVLNVRVCRHGRQEFASGALKKLKVDCDVYRMDREGRRVSNIPISLLLAHGSLQGIDTASVRRAMLVSIVAENSSSQRPCKRFIAVPKACTQIGWVSLLAVVILAFMLLASAVIRCALRYLTRASVHWNGDPEALVNSIFEHFDAAPRAFKAKHNDIHISVLSSARDIDQYHVAWTRDPVDVTPAVRVQADRVVPTPDAVEEEHEVSLV